MIIIVCGGVGQYQFKYSSLSLSLSLPPSSLTRHVCILPSFVPCVALEEPGMRQTGSFVCGTDSIHVAAKPSPQLQLLLHVVLLCGKIGMCERKERRRETLSKMEWGTVGKKEQGGPLSLSFFLSCLEEH